MECVKMFAQTDDANPPITGCLPRSGELAWHMPKSFSGPIGMPATARGMQLFVEAPGESVSDLTGVVQLLDPMNNTLYSPPASVAEYYALPVRYQGAEGSSTMLVSNAPALVTLGYGVYTFQAAAQNPMNQLLAFTVTARFKLADAQPTSGSIPLHVFVTDLSGAACSGFNAAAAPSKLGGFEQTLQSIYQAAGLSVGPIVYFDSTAPSMITVPDSGAMPELDALLKQATNGDAPNVLEMTLVKSISSTGGAFEVLGVSGGVPASTGIPGTVHSGVAVSLSALCEGGQNALAITAGHELGHSMGLFHNVEQSGATDAITDDDTDGINNLMYWLEGSPTQMHLSPQQAEVILANPAVQ
jgi:hypothetical protein